MWPVEPTGEYPNAFDRFVGEQCVGLKIDVAGRGDPVQLH
jgi:hypothetical protein